MTRGLMIAGALLIAWNCQTRAEDTMTGIFNPDIHTLRICPEDNPLGAPVIYPDGPALEVSFDHLSEDREFFRYSLTHCNADWQPSQLVESEYLPGFNEGIVEDYAYSEGTLTHYVHYRIRIPEGDMTPTVSGNYLLRVYPESDPDSTVLQARFYITEETAPVRMDVSGRTDIDYREAHQQVEVRVETERAQVEDVFNDLTVVVGQNGRLDSEVAFRQPLSKTGTTAIFAHRPELIFQGGNEYRRFETVSDHYPGMGVASVDFYRPYYHYTLYTDEPRDEQPYSYDSTQNGRFLIRRSGADNSDVEAEYGVVHFSLAAPYMPGHLVFLDGDFTNRRFDANALMTYNDNTGCYERSMLLKQGAFNYQYLVVPPGGRRGYTRFVEGDYYPTVNEYFVRVYHRRRGERYDRLIGVGTIRSDYSITH